MTYSASLTCRDDAARRKRTRGAALFGLDYVELGAAPNELIVCFLGRAPNELQAASVRVEGGRRVRDLEVQEVSFERASDAALDDRMIVRLDRAGDASNYVLRIVALDEHGRPSNEPPSDFDPRYDRVLFTFGIDCPNALDCKPQSPCAELPGPAPVIDYLAKDYASFRQLMLDRLSLLIPEWQERHVADLGVTLVELIAYAADRLSYHQDAVATEAYLDTARTRIALRRHLRLVDYRLHEGCNARAWLALTVGQDLTLARDTFFVATPHPLLPSGPIDVKAWSEHGDALAPVFEPIWPDGAREITLRRERNVIRFYTWLGAECCLARGATSATLLDPGQYPDPPEVEDDECGPDEPTLEPSSEQIDAAYRLQLAPCDVLIFEEVRGPKTGAAADADPSHRHAVRLTRVERHLDPVPDPKTGKPTLVWEVYWGEEDALPFPLCLSSIAASCELQEDVSVAYGNVIGIDHGRTVDEALEPVPELPAAVSCDTACTGAETTRTAGRYRPRLDRRDVTHAEPYAPCFFDAVGCKPAAPRSAASLFERDPRQALAQATLAAIPSSPDGQAAFSPADLRDPTELARRLANVDASSDPSLPRSWLWRQLPTSLKRGLRRWTSEAPDAPLPEALRTQLVARLEHLQTQWTVQPDLLGSGPGDRHFVVEIDDERRAQLRFGDGLAGAKPPAGAYFHARYRAGNGVAGNVGADTLTQLVFLDQLPEGAELRARNPLPAQGGTTFEDASEARRRGPLACRHELQRAITAQDYAELAMREFPSQLQRAAATLRWNGHRTELHVALDPRSTSCDPTLACQVAQRLQRYRRIGHDVRVALAVQVPLRLVLHACVAPDYAQGHVRAGLLAELGARALPDGRLGFFHPDALSFGQSIYISQLIARALRVKGVVAARVETLERYWDAPNVAFHEGLLAIDALEIARLDNDPTRPEHGLLTLNLEGGR